MISSFYSTEVYLGAFWCSCEATPFCSSLWSHWSRSPEQWPCLFTRIKKTSLFWEVDFSFWWKVRSSLCFLSSSTGLEIRHSQVEGPSGLFVLFWYSATLWLRLWFLAWTSSRIATRLNAKPSTSQIMRRAPQEVQFWELVLRVWDEWARDSLQLSNWIWSGLYSSEDHDHLIKITHF